jgi:hypothetical protein
MRNLRAAEAREMPAVWLFRRVEGPHAVREVPARPPLLAGVVGDFHVPLPLERAVVHFDLDGTSGVAT